MVITAFKLPEFSIAALPQILLIILIIVLFAALVFWIIGRLNEPIKGWAIWIAVALGGILLLWFLISLVR